MRYIEGIGYVDETKYYNSIKKKHEASNEFDNIFDAETSVYAKPDPDPTRVNINISNRSLEKAVAPKELDEYFNEASATYNVDIALLKAVAKAESDFDPNSTSSSGAMGIMQLMPETAKGLGVSNAYDPHENILGGAHYLKKMLDKFNGDVSLALAAYNAGPNNVDKYNGIPPFEETQNYVRRVMEYAGMAIEIPQYSYGGSGNGNYVYDPDAIRAVPTTPAPIDRGSSPVAIIQSQPGTPTETEVSAASIYNMISQDSTNVHRIL